MAKSIYALPPGSGSVTEEPLSLRRLCFSVPGAGGLAECRDPGDSRREWDMLTPVDMERKCLRLTRWILSQKGIRRKQYNEHEPATSTLPAASIFCGASCHRIFRPRAEVRLAPFPCPRGRTLSSVSGVGPRAARHSLSGQATLPESSSVNHQSALLRFPHRPGLPSELRRMCAAPHSKGRRRLTDHHSNFTRPHPDFAVPSSAAVTRGLRKGVELTRANI